MDVGSSVYSIKRAHGKAHAEASETRGLSKCPRWLFCLLIPALLLLLGEVHAQAQQMRTLKNQRVTLRIDVLSKASGTTMGTPVYSKLMQKEPYIEVQLMIPVSANRLHRGRMSFLCEEVGIFDQGSPASTWTIGKRCSPR